MASWHLEVLTTSGNASDSFGLVGYVFDAQGTQHVDYVGNDGHVHELWWDTDGWHSNDLTLAANAPTADPGSINNFMALDGYVFNAQGTQHVDYVGNDGHVYELWWDTSGWHNNDLSVAAKVSSPRPPHGGETALIAGYVFDAQGTQHVTYFATDDGDIHELWWDTSGWHSNDLTLAAGAPNVLAIAGAGYVFGAQGTQHVIYSAEGGGVYELWWDANGWHYNDLTAALGGFSSITTGVGNDGQLQVIGLGQDDGLPYLIWQDPNGNWTGRA
jgi:hypothetical protein